MALAAGNRWMCPGQRELRSGMIERRRLPCIRRMTIVARRRKTRRHVFRVRHPVGVGLMAGKALH
jgi:hypothetical protein